MTLNKKVKSFLKEKGIPVTEGILYLLSLYHELDEPTCISEEVIRKVNFEKLVERDYKSGTLQWNIPLFEGQIVDNVWSWINEWRDMFKVKNSDRVGVKAACVSRMKKLFAENPHIRKEDVIEATEAYLRITEGKYIKKAHKFIKDGSGTMAFSTLLEWIEKIQERKDNQKQDPNTKMM